MWVPAPKTWRARSAVVASVVRGRLPVLPMDSPGLKLRKVALGRVVPAGPGPGEAGAGGAHGGDGGFDGDGVVGDGAAAGGAALGGEAGAGAGDLEVAGSRRRRRRRGRRSGGCRRCDRG